MIGNPLVALDSRNWDRERCIAERSAAVRDRHSLRLLGAVLAADTLQCWPDAVSELAHVPAPDPEWAASLLWFWNEQGLYSIGHGLRDQIYLLAEVLRQYVAS